MDIDRLTTEERAQLMKEGKCFKCRKQGHLSKDCPPQGTETLKPWSGKTAATHIRSIISRMMQKEKDNLEKEAEASGIVFLKRRVTLMLMSPSLDIYLINAVNNLNSLYLSITILHNKKDEMNKAKTLLDSGARGIFIDQNFAQKHNLRKTKLKQLIKAQNMDGTKNKQGTIHFYTDLDIKIGNQTFQKRFHITGLGNQKFILGFPWLRTHNPEIDWEKGTVTWRNLEQLKTLVKKW